MKLRNKQTGEIRELPDGFFCGDNLKKICEEWEDYEEPKGYWRIDCDGEIEDDEYEGTSFDKDCKAIGNYFETKEEAEKALEKLKAWKRLKDKGFRFTGINDNEDSQELITQCGILCEADIYHLAKDEDFLLLFGEEITLCENCWCITHTSDGKCAKCEEVKMNRPKDLNAPSRWNMRIWDDYRKEWLCQSDKDALTYYGFDITGGKTTEFQGLPKWHPDRHLIWEQSTGLKDKNGKEIYEGDIVEEDIDFNSKMTDGTFRYKVYWNEDELCWSLDPIGPESIHNDLWELNSSCRVIGNIHEPPRDFRPEHLKRMGVSISKGGEE